MSMRGRVAIVGMGSAASGLGWRKSHEDLLVEAGQAALAAAGIDKSQVQASWFGATTVSANHALLNFSLKLGYTAMTKISNAGATAADVLRHSYLAVASGTYDIVLAAGVEKPTDAGFQEFREGESRPGGATLGEDAVVAEFRPPVHSAFYLTRYQHEYGVDPARMRAALTRIVTRNRRNGARNPLAHYRQVVTEDEVGSAPVSVPPYTPLDCCDLSDGATAAIVTTRAIAEQLGRPYMVLEGLGMASGGMEGRTRPDYAYTGLPEVRIAAERAYAMAGITDPLHEIDHMQLFDLTSGAELLAYEDLGLAPPGHAVDLVLDGVFDTEGQAPANTDGGLLSNGFQAGATGLRQVYEAYLQLTGQAGERQLPAVRRSLVHTVGGAVGSFTAAVQIFGQPG